MPANSKITTIAVKCTGRFSKTTRTAAIAEKNERQFRLGCRSASSSVMRRSGSHCVKPSNSDHAPSSSSKPKSHDPLPGPLAHSSSTLPPSSPFPSRSDTRSAASSMALLASFIDVAGCSAGVASLSSVNPTPNASNAAVGAAPVASRSPIPDTSTSRFTPKPANIPATPRDRLLTRLNCSGAPYVGSKMASDPSVPCPVW
mmetsp:Transcript_9739/g.39448  ORF Transcript_9739/g.39448 Transcript_9739/m.39448 type:complete len:201 (-) Transcript_9739:930-1532(-)